VPWLPTFVVNIAVLYVCCGSDSTKHSHFVNELCIGSTNDSSHDPAVDSERFRRDLKHISLPDMRHERIRGFTGLTESRYTN